MIRAMLATLIVGLASIQAARLRGLEAMLLRPSGAPAGISPRPPTQGWMKIVET